MIKRFLIAKSMALLFLNATSQNYEIKVGQKVPPDLLAKIKDFIPNSNGKKTYIILDFWATSCSACIHDFPMLKNLQASFPDSLSIISVTQESAKKVADFKKRNTLFKNYSLPVITDGKWLNQYFPHVTIPHVIWIDQQGILRAITYADYLSIDNIRQALRGHISFPLKWDLLIEKSKPLLSFPAPIKNIPYYSFVSKYIPGIAPSGGIQVDSNNGSIRFYNYNQPILNLYAATLYEAISQDFPLFYRGIKLCVADSSKYVPTGKYISTWEQENSYCYEGVFPITMPFDSIKKKMRSDLNTFLNLTGTVQKSTMKCIVLYIKEPLPPSEETRPSLNFSTKVERQYAHGKTISNIVRQINACENMPPVLNRTGITYKVDIDLGVCSIADIPLFISRLKSAGLEVKIEDVDLNFLTIND